MKKISTPENRGGDLQRIRDMRKEFMDACRALCDVVREELPTGTIIEATLGSARIRGEVVDHHNGWSAWGAGDITVRNLKTGKLRSVTPHYEGHELKVISIP